jgi:hypothetical protein
VTLVSTLQAPAIPIAPLHFEPSTRGLGYPHAAPEDVHGAVGAPFLDGEWGAVPKARALSHYSGEPSWKKADYSNLDRRPDRMRVYRAGLRKKPRA